MNELKLHRNPSLYISAPLWRDARQNRLLCGSAVQEHVDIPQGVLDIVLVFSPRRQPESFKFKLKYADTSMATVVICGTNEVPLYDAFEVRLRRELKKGNSYFRVGYE